MANVCTGISVTWSGQTLGEVTEIDTRVGGSLPLARASTWSLDAGTISLKCLSTAAIAVSEYGKKATLSIQGGGLTYSTKAICESLQMAGKVNDVARYAATFRIAME
jgi:hypothetical protein